MAIHSPWTFDEISFLEDNYNLMTIKEISDELDRTQSGVRGKAYQLGLKRVTEFAVYKGEENLAIGTAEECAEKTGLKKYYIQWLSTPAGRKRAELRGENSIVVMKL